MKEPRFFRALRVSLLCTAGAFVLVLIGLPGAGCAPTTQPPPEQGVTDVRIQGLAFSPQTVTIKQGESVRWTNNDFVLHTATSGNPGDADAGSIFDTGTILRSQSRTVQFNNTGDFVYFCRQHPTMMFNAHVIVTP
jgi:plastocyanin